jgi:hypothetical protein
VPSALRTPFSAITLRALAETNFFVFRSSVIVMSVTSWPLVPALVTTLRPAEFGRSHE